MTDERTKLENIKSLFDEARNTEREGGITSFRRAEGACIAIIPGSPDYCEQLTRRECSHVDKRLREQGGKADWFGGQPCPR